MTKLIQCDNCGTDNRVEKNHKGTAVCGKCHTPLSEPKRSPLLLYGIIFTAVMALSAVAIGVFVFAGSKAFGTDKPDPDKPADPVGVSVQVVDVTYEAGETTVRGTITGMRDSMNAQITATIPTQEECGVETTPILYGNGAWELGFWAGENASCPYQDDTFEPIVPEDVFITSIAVEDDYWLTVPGIEV